MRRIYEIAGAALVAIVLLVGAFTYQEALTQRLSLSSDLQYRTRILASSLEESLRSSVASNATSTVQRIVNRIATNARIVGLGVFDTSGVLVAKTNDLPDSIISGSLVSGVLDSDQPSGIFVSSSNGSQYVLVQPLHQDGRVTGAIAVVQNAAYIDDDVAKIWRDSLWRLLVQIFVIALAFFAIVRFVFFRSVKEFAEALSTARKGGESSVQGHGTLFQPLAREISTFTSSLRQARRAAAEEARLRLEKLDTPWTAERLKEFMKASLKERPVYVVSNREPYIHSRNKRGEIEWTVPASGMVTAMEPVMEAAEGLWLAHGSGSADTDVVDQEGNIRVPPDDPKYTLKRIFLTDKEVQGHYVGFSNEALWPLCHQAHTRPIFREEDWREYRKVNGKFAAALLTEIKGVERPIILVQDFHFALLPAMIKASRPDALVGIFWHVPWPSPAGFSICPYRAELLEGILGADLIGFHTQQYCNNFMDTVGNEIEALISLEEFTVTRGGHVSKIKPFPISIAFGDMTQGEKDRQEKADPGVLAELGIKSRHLILGVDRLDYTKGILERFKGFEYMLDNHPKYKGAVTLLQIAPPSREAVAKYREYGGAVTQEAARINERLGTRDWRPIVLEKQHYSHAQLDNLYRIASVALVTSLHDGMNLVAKEYVAARADEAGVLVLSTFTGAARDLKGALLVNPYSAEEIGDAIHAALAMPLSEQHRHMKQMRRSVRDYNIYRWSAEFIKSLSEHE